MNGRAACLPSAPAAASIRPIGKVTPMARGAPGVKRGPRGLAPKRFRELEALYDLARPNFPRDRHLPVCRDIMSATGDPLAYSDPELARHLYGIEAASRPQKHLERLGRLTWGDSIDSAIMMMGFFKDRRQLTDIMAAAETVTLLAQRRTFIGVRAPVSFAEAVDTTRKAFATRHRRARAPEGWTGAWLWVLPLPGGRVRDPEDLSILEASGSWVKDTLFWRKCVEHKDVDLLARTENTPTNRSDLCLMTCPSDADSVHTQRDTDEP